jgi:excisionase family DNA binding protein
MSELVTVPEAADLLRLKPSTVRDWILKRRIPFVKLGGRVFLQRSNLELLIAESLVPADPSQVQRQCKRKAAIASSTTEDRHAS